jgi:thiosulfate dehydrogenase
MKRLAILPALGLAVLGASACPADPEEIHKTAIEHGQALFDDPTASGASFNKLSCSMCHDEHAGDSNLDKSGAPLAGALRRPTYWGGTEDTLLGSINACLYYFMQGSEPWKGDEDEATAIYAYLEALDAEATDAERAAVPFTIAPVSVPGTGDPANGKTAYDASCATCHGAKSTGEGRTVDTAPLLPEQTLKAHPSPDYTDADRRLVFVEKTRHGGFLGYGGQMPPLSAERLSDQDVADLLAYLGVP